MCMHIKSADRRGLRNFDIRQQVKSRMWNVNLSGDYSCAGNVTLNPAHWIIYPVMCMSLPYCLRFTCHMSWLTYPHAGMYLLSSGAGEDTIDVRLGSIGNRLVVQNCIAREAPANCSGKECWCISPDYLYIATTAISERTLSLSNPQNGEASQYPSIKDSATLRKKENGILP